MRHSRILLVAALAGLTLCTIRMTMACFRSPVECAETQAPREQGPEELGPSLALATHNSANSAGRAEAETPAAGVLRHAEKTQLKPTTGQRESVAPEPPDATTRPETAQSAAELPRSDKSSELATVIPTGQARPDRQESLALSIVMAEIGLRVARTCDRIAQQSSEAWQKLSPHLDAALTLLRQASYQPIAQIPDGTREKPALPAAQEDITAESSPPQGLVLLNSEETGGSVSYLLNGHVHSLRPGQRQELPADQSWRIQFHRGDDFGNAEHTLTSGTYTFRVSKQGWELFRSGQALPGAENRTNY